MTGEQLAKHFGIVAKPAPEIPKARWAVYHYSYPYQSRIIVADTLTLDEVRDETRFPLGFVELNGIKGTYGYALMNEYQSPEDRRKVSRTEYLGGIHKNAICDRNP